MANTTFTVILGSNAYTSERAYSALNFCLTSLKEGIDVNLFLMEDGVFVAKKGQNPENFRSAEDWLRTVIEAGATVKLCGTCCKERGLNPAEFVDGVEKGGMKDLVDWVKNADKALFF